MKIFITAALATVALSATQTTAAYPPEVSALIDTDADPCEDFFQYTCGKWIKNYNLPADRTQFSYSFHGIAERNEPVIQAIIKEDWPLIGELWDSCLATDALNALGNKPLQPFLKDINDAQQIGKLASLAGEFGRIGPSLFTGLGVGADTMDPKNNVLYVGSAGTMLTAAQYNSSEPAIRTYISKLVTLAGINLTNDKAQSGQATGGKTVDSKYVEDIVIAIEKAVQGIKITDGAEYQTLTYAQAKEKYPVAFGKLVDGADVLKYAPAAFTTESKVVIDSLQYMDAIEALFKSTKFSLFDYKLYYSVLYANAFAPYLGDAFVTANWELFSKALVNAKVQSPRTTVCTAAQTTFFPDLIGKYYFLKMFDIQRVENVQAMVAAIEKAMGEHIEQLSWLDAPTRAEAEDKLKKVANLIGKSTQKKSYKFALSRDDYFANVQAVKTNSFRDEMAKINLPVDRTEWSMSAATVNAYYSPSENKMVFPAAILQPPFYSGGVHPVQNFGAVGAVIGHELTHGFDNSGRRYDGDGMQREWWTNSTRDEFNKRANCLANQYAKLPVYGDTGAIVGSINGNRTLGENIADNGGVSLAFDAYHSYAKSGVAFNDHGVLPEEVDKLFFISYAQVWCNKITDAQQKQLLITDVHSPKRARVNGVAMNSGQFADTFQCKDGAKMKLPEAERCKLWNQ